MTTTAPITEIIQSPSEIESPPVIKTTFQYDFLPIKKKNITQIAGGGIRVKGTMASSGWLEYTMPDGSTQLQYVPFETLTDKEHQDALLGMTLTLLHPNEPVSPVSYRNYAVGSVISVTPNNRSKQLDCEIAINEAEAITAVLDGKITDLSCGYQVEKELMEDNKYRQVKRIPNHLSLVPAGRDAKAQLHLDSATQVLRETIEVTVKESTVKETKHKPIEFVSYLYD